eukprot:3247098-Amphidinium_carterae.1
MASGRVLGLITTNVRQQEFRVLVYDAGWQSAAPHQFQLAHKQGKSLASVFGSTTRPGAAQGGPN